MNDKNINVIQLVNEKENCFVKINRQAGVFCYRSQYLRIDSSLQRYSILTRCFSKYGINKSKVTYVVVGCCVAVDVVKSKSVPMITPFAYYLVI